MIVKIKKIFMVFSFGISVSFMAVGSTFALSAEQKLLYDSGISNWDIADDITCGDNSSSGGGVYVLGDSLTVGMKDAGGLETKLTEAKWQVSKIQATVGHTISQAMGKLAEDKDQVAKSGTIVIALGTNPAGLTTDENVAKIIEMIKGKDGEEGMAPNAQIKWMNIHTANNNWQAFNEFLKSQADALNFDVIDYAAEAQANPGKYTYAAADGVHLDGVGYSNKADFLVKSLGDGGGTNTTDGETNPIKDAGTVLGDKNIGYDGENKIWTEEELAKIETNKPFYTKAADEADVPWQLIAVIHRNESGLGRTNPGNGQGIYQFYNGDGGPYPAGEVDDAEFQRQTTFMANKLQRDFVTRNHSSNAGPLKKSGTPPNVIQDMLFSYNGRAGVYTNQAKALGYSAEGEGFHGSPYVMNRADQPRDPTVEPTKSNGTWGQIKTDGGSLSYPANSHWGGWILYAALAGIDGSTGGTCGGEPGGTGNVNAEGYAFPVEPQTKKGNGGGYFSDLPCPQANCHTHTDFVAFDIGRDPFANSTGAAVYAIYDGKITGLSIFETYQGCYEFTLVASDGASYYYTHTSDVVVQEGQDVKAGDKLAQIGPQPCVDGGANPSAHQAHLHIQQLKNNTISPDLTPLMNEIFNGLPEE